jgi:hypothetical protein
MDTYLSPVLRSACMSRKNGRGRMVRKAYWCVPAPILLALAFLTGCSSTPATVTPAAVTTVTAMSPFVQNTVINKPFASSLSATVTTNGTPVSGALVSFTAPGSGAGGTFPNGTETATATTDANGVAKSPIFTANGTVGTYIVIASAGSTQSTALFNMANTLEAEALSTAGGTPQSTSISTQFANALAVTVKDPTGATVGAGVPVTFTAPDGYFTDTDKLTTTALTNASGVATAAPYVASGTVGGQYSVIASTVDTVDGDSSTATFTLSNTIKPATITPSAGTTPQSATAGTPFVIPLAVTVMDGSTPPVPVSNALVTFTAPSFTVTSGTASAASGTFADSTTVTTTAWTNGSGVATAAIFTANSKAGGPYNVTAMVVVSSGNTLTTNFSLTNQ